MNETPKRITITVEDGISDADALQCVMRVVDGGKITGHGKYYSAVTMFKHPNYDKEVAVYTTTRCKEGDSAFVVMLYLK